MSEVDTHDDGSNELRLHSLEHLRGKNIFSESGSGRRYDGVDFNVVLLSFECEGVCETDKAQFGSADGKTKLSFRS